MIKKLRASLTVKIFLLVSLLLLAASGITYAAVVWFLPTYYSNELEKSIDRLSQELAEIIQSFSSIEDASNAIALFQRDTKTSVAILDEDGNYVWYWVQSTADEATAVEEDVITQYALSNAWSYGEDTVAEEAQEEAIPGAGDEAGQDEPVRDDEAEQDEPVRDDETEQDEPTRGDEAEQDEPVRGDEAEQNEPVRDDEPVWSDEVAVMQDFAGYGQVIFPGTELEGAAVKSYSLLVGEKFYTMFVTGGMQPVNQAMGILRQIFPYIVVIAVCVAVLSALAASFYLTMPVVRLSRLSRKMARLDFSGTYQGKRTDEIGVLGQNLNELARNLSGALSGLQQANARLKSDIEQEREQERRRMAFFAAVSHELKTPITILKGHLFGMLQGIGEYKDREYYLRRSQETAEKMESMVQELLTVSRMETTPFTVSRTDLAEQLRLQLADLTELFEAKKLELIPDLPEHLWARVNGALTEKVFRNLLTNALRYTPAGGGNQIRLRLCRKEESILFDIENTGIHIPEDALPHIFDAFYRVEQSRSRQMGGSGLGLYIVRMALEQHGAVYGAAGFSREEQNGELMQLPGASAGYYGAENTRDGVRFYFALVCSA